MGKNRRTIVIVGGGIAGLSTAYFLQRFLREAGGSLECFLLEQRERLGGVIRTERESGFLLDAGPDSFLVEKPAALKLCEELGLQNRFLPTNADQQAVYIWSNRRLKKMPAGLLLTVPTQLSSFLASDLFTWRGKLRMALERYRPRRVVDADESIADFVGRRFGQEAVEKLAGPLMAGIFAGDARRLSMRSTFPRFIELERCYGSLIKGLRREKRSGGTGSQPLFLSLRGGMGELVAALEERLDPSTVRVGQKVLALRRLPRKASGRYEIVLAEQDPLQADAVVLAIPSSRAAMLLEEFDGELTSGLQEIRIVSTGVVFLGYRERDLARPLDGFGFLVSRHIHSLSERV